MATKKLLVVHTNDIQDAPMDQFSRLAALVGSLQRSGRRRAITLDAGDGFQFFDLMRFVDYDAVGLGNEDLTESGLAAIKRVSGSLPFVSANFELKVPGRKLSRRPRWCRPYRILRRAGLRVAVLGFVMQDRSFRLSKRYDPTVVVRNPIEAAREWVPRARAASDILIVLFHGWLPQRDRLVKEFGEIDVLLSGHEHLVAGYGNLLETIVGQAHSNIRSVGRLELSVNRGSVQSWSSSIHPAESHGATHPEVDHALASNSHNGADSVIIAQALTDFRPDRYWLDINGNNVNLRPNTPLGNWLVDSIRTFAGADVALQKAWGIQHNLGPGPIRESDVDDMILYDENLWVIRLRGEDLRAVLEYSFERSYNNLAFSGLELTVNYRRAPGRRIVKAFVDGKRLHPRRIYSVATSDFLAGGNTGFRWMRNAVDSTALGMRLREFVVDRLKDQGELEGVRTGRLTEIGTQTN